MILIRYLFLYIIILSISLFLADCLKKKLERTIPLGLIIIILILYLFGIIKQLPMGVLFISLFSIILLIYTIGKNVKKKTLQNLKQKIVSPGNVFFTILFFVFMITTMNREITHWDQFTYWSLSAKDMFYTNDMLLIMKDSIWYPPVPTLLQYFFMKMIGEYAQGIEIFTTWLLGFSFFLPLFEKTNRKKLTNFIVSILILCVPAVFQMLIFYESSYPDALLGILIGYLSYCYFCEENSLFKSINIGLTLALLTLTKSTGFAIAIILFITFLLFEILVKRKEKQGLKHIIFSKEIKTIGVFFIIIILTYASWTIYKKQTKEISNMPNEVASIVSENKIQNVINSILPTLFTVNREDTSYEDSNGNLIEKLYHVPEISTPVEISAAGLICIYIVITLYYYSKIKQEEKARVKNIAISILTGLVLYIVALQLAYLTQFSVKEMVAHDGMERYIASYLLGILYFMVCFILDKIKRIKNTTLPYALLASIILLITPITSVANATITSGVYNTNTIYYCNNGRLRANKILDMVQPEEKVLGICQDEKMKLINLMIRYYMYPITYHLENIEEKENVRDIIEKGEYQYIYIMITDEELTKQFEEEFHIEIENDTLFKITNEGLEKIEKER